MIKDNRILDLTPIDTIFSIKKTSAETNGSAFEMEWELFPYSEGTPLHIHPCAKEKYTILEGSMDVFINGKWQTLSKGETITVHEGIPHTFKNSSDKITRVYNVHEPAMQFENYFRDLAKVVNKLSGNGKNKLKMNFTVATYMSMLMNKYPDEIVSVKPPAFATKILSSLGKLRGCKI